MDVFLSVAAALLQIEVELPRLRVPKSLIRGVSMQSSVVLLLSLLLRFLLTGVVGVFVTMAPTEFSASVLCLISYTAVICCSGSFIFVFNLYRPATAAAIVSGSTSCSACGMHSNGRIRNLSSCKQP